MTRRTQTRAIRPAIEGRGRVRAELTAAGQSAGHSLNTNDLNRPRQRRPLPAVRRRAWWRWVWSRVSRPTNRDNAPSRSGRSGRCQWFGMTQ